MIGIESITASGTLRSNVTLLSSSIGALTDKTLPYLWLPLQLCQRFVTAFGLSWDASTEIYLVNDTIHQQLLNVEPSVTFTLGTSPANQSINITMPCGAFDLQASAPIYPYGTSYVFLRRASNQTNTHWVAYAHKRRIDSSISNHHRNSHRLLSLRYHPLHHPHRHLSHPSRSERVSHVMSSLPARFAAKKFCFCAILTPRLGISK